MPRNVLSALQAAAALALCAAPAHAAPFLPSYTGPASPALDLGSISVTFDGTNFDLASTSSAPISSAPAGSVFVWGVNRGSGTARFVVVRPTAANPTIGSNVLFDAVLAINPATGSATVNFFNGTSIPLPAPDLTISGDTINALLPASLLPSTGLPPSAYTFDLWPRVGVGLNDQVAQFDGVTNSVNPANIGATLVPEPGSLAILGSILALFALVLRRTPSRKPARA